MIGQTLNGYEVVEAIDKRTYRAVKEDKFVAVHWVERQRVDRQVAFTLPPHPHVLPVLAQGDQYVITDWSQGGTLRNALRQRLAPDHALLIAQQISGALAHAHQHAIVHGGVRPQAIHFWDAEHQHAVLFGFGLPHKMSRRAAAYVSPELAQDLPTDARSDVYSLGVVLYEMLLGELPFSAESTFATLTQHINEPLPDLNNKLPEATAYIVEKALQKDPAQRFQSAQAMMEALQLARLAQAGGDVPSTMIGPPNTTIFKRPRREPAVEISAEPQPQKRSRFRFWKR